MAEENRKIIERRRLANGMELVLYDCSRFMAADRWLVELLCEAHIPISDSYWEITAGEDPVLVSAIREKLGEKLVFGSNKKRIFVAAEERERILREQVQQVYNSILEYLSRPDFPRRLFVKQYQDARRQVLLRQATQRQEKSAAAE